MKSTFLLIATAAIAFPATASVVVIGNSAARYCYEAADSPARPSQDSLGQCTRALYEEPLTDYEIAATHVNRGILLVRRNKIADGMRDFDRALELDPDQPEAYLNKGIALLRMEGRAQEALPLFETALQKQTKRPALAYYGRAIAHEDMGNLRSAYRDYKLASTTDPKWRVPLRELARFSVR